MFRRKKSTRSVYTQTDFRSDQRSRDPIDQRRRSSYRSPEKNRKCDDIGSSCEREQKNLIASRFNKESFNGLSTERDQKHRGSLRDEPRRNYSIDKSRDNDRTRDSKSSAKRSRSKSPRRTDEKRRKLDEQRPKHKEDLRQTLLKKQASRSSPRKAKAETTVKAEPKTKVTSPKKRKPVQSQDEAPAKPLSIKSSDSEVEIVSVVDSKEPKKFDPEYRIPFKKSLKEKIIEEGVSQKMAEPANEAAEERKMLAVQEVTQNEKSSSLYSTDEGSKSPRLTELEKEILAAENFNLQQEAGCVAVNRNSDKVPLKKNDEKIVEELEGIPGSETIPMISTSSAAVPPPEAIEIQESSPVKKATPEVEPETTVVSPASEVLRQNSPVKPQPSPAKPKPSPVKVIASSPVPVTVEQESTKTEPADQSLQESQPLLNGTLDSSGASKENSLNKSQKKKKKHSSKTYEKEVQEDGTVVIVITSKTKKKKKKDKSKA